MNNILCSRLAGDDYAWLGTTQTRKKTLKEISRQVATGKLDLESDDIEELKKQLLALPGVGKWTVEYIGMRGLGHTDSFPGSDLVLKRATNAHPKLNIEKVSPWRSYAALYLWKDYAMQPEKYAQPVKPKKGIKK